MNKETQKRSIIKSICYRLFGTLTTIIIALLFTGSFPASLGIGLLELVSKIILYYIYERIWQNIKWGKIE